MLFTLFRINVLSNQSGSEIGMICACDCGVQCVWCLDFGDNEF